MNIGGKLDFGPIELVTTAIAVPADFLGIYFGYYPGTSPAPTGLRYKNTCQIDYEGNLGTIPSSTCWLSIETSAGVYDFTRWDAWCDAHYSNASLTYCLQGIPAFWSLYPTATGYWSGKLGFGGPLTAGGRVGLTNFLTALIAHNISRGKPIKYIQCWTEPNFNAAQSGLPTSGSGTWWGTTGDLVDLCKTAFDAIRAADATIKILSPSMFYKQFSSFISVAGTVNAGTQGYQTCDWLSTDLFNAGPPALGYGTDERQSDGSFAFLNDCLASILRVRSDVAAHLLPIAVTSFGFEGAAYTTGGYPSSQAAVLSNTALWRKQWLARTLLVYAALGVKQALCYAWDTSLRSQYFCGDFLTDTNGVVAAFNEISDNVLGKTIISCTYRQGGQVKAIFSDSSTYTI